LALGHDGGPGVRPFAMQMPAVCVGPLGFGQLIDPLNIFFLGWFGRALEIGPSAEKFVKIITFYNKKGR
jgi:hypothetical protein